MNFIFTLTAIFGLLSTITLAVPLDLITSSLATNITTVNNAFTAVDAYFIIFCVDAFHINCERHDNVKSGLCYEIQPVISSLITQEKYTCTLFADSGCIGDVEISLTNLDQAEEANLATVLFNDLARSYRCVAH